MQATPFLSCNSLRQTPTLYIRSHVQTTPVYSRQRNAHSHLDRRQRYSSSISSGKDSLAKNQTNCSPYKSELASFMTPDKKSMLMIQRAITNDKLKVLFINNRTVETNCKDIKECNNQIGESQGDYETKSDNSSIEDEKRTIKLLTPLYSDGLPTVFCTYPEVCGIARECANAYNLNDPKIKLKFKFGNAVRYNCIMKALDAAGFVETEGSDWNIYWSSPLKTESLKAFTKYQKCNHFPAAWQLGRKDNLWYNISR